MKLLEIAYSVWSEFGLGDTERLILRHLEVPCCLLTFQEESNSKTMLQLKKTFYDPVFLVKLISFYQCRVAARYELMITSSGLSKVLL
jgi:hypothetical protein